LFSKLFNAWLPGDAVVALHGSVSRSAMLSQLPKPSLFYKRKFSKATHSAFGGVTTSSWHLIHYSCVRDPITAPALMTREHYAQTLQSSLDDTVARTGEAFTFEPCLGQQYIGTVHLRKTGVSLCVYDADGLGPDLSLIASSRFLFFWVRAATVWSKDKSERVLRPIRLYERSSRSGIMRERWSASFDPLRSQLLHFGCISLLLRERSFVSFLTIFWNPISLLQTSSLLW
jgi:hypothetical protein